MDNPVQAMTIVAIYARPDDYPHGYVTRRWFVFVGSDEDPTPVPDMSSGHFPTHEAARAWIELMHPSLEPTEPNPSQDDPKICEVYL